MDKDLQMMNRPKVSVIIPVYNTGLYLHEMFDSVLKQTLRDIEVILINDGSTDDSLTILKEYAAKDQRIRVVTQTNQGLSITRNVGLEHAGGKYIYFLDSDDALELETLEICYKQCEENQLDVITFDASVFGEDLHLFNKNYYMRSTQIQTNKIYVGIDLLKHTLLNFSFRSSVCLYMMKKEVIDRNNLRFYPKIIHEDQLFTTQLFACCERVKYEPFTFFRRRFRKDSIMTHPFGWRNLVGYTTVFDQLLGYNWSDEQREVIRLHVSITLNAILRHVAKGLTWSQKMRFLRICHSRYRGLYMIYNFFFFLMRR